MLQVVEFLWTHVCPPSAETNTHQVALTSLMVVLKLWTVNLKNIVIVGDRSIIPFEGPYIMRKKRTIKVTSWLEIYRSKRGIMRWKADILPCIYNISYNMTTLDLAYVMQTYVMIRFHDCIMIHWKRALTIWREVLTPLQKYRAQVLTHYYKLIRNPRLKNMIFWLVPQHRADPTLSEA